MFRGFVRDSRWALYLWSFLVVGFVAGALMRTRTAPYSSRDAMYIRLAGDLWVNAPPARASVGDCVVSLVRNLLPDNPVEACIRHKEGVLVPKGNETVPGYGSPYSQYKTQTYFVYQPDMLGVVVGMLAVGMAMALLRDGVSTLLEVTETVRDACVVIARWLLVIGGPFVALEVIGELAGAKGLEGQLVSMKEFLVAVIVTFALQALVFYPLLYFLIAPGWNAWKPFQLIWSMSETFIVAVSAQSSNAAYPFAHRALTQYFPTHLSASVLTLSVMSVANNDGSAALLTAAALWTQARQHLMFRGVHLSAVALGLLGSVAIGGETFLHREMLVMALATLGGATRPGDLAPILTLSWLMNPLAAAVNIMCSAFAAAIAGAAFERFQAAKEAKED